MDIIMGASGRVGSAIVTNLIKKGRTVKGIVRNNEKAEPLRKQGADFVLADAFNLPALTGAIKGGTTLFIITPETGKGDDVIADTKKILENIRKAIEESTIKKIVGLSSMGAQYDKGTGNLLMSYLLEHEFKNTEVEQTFIRPAYYFSNWLAYLPVVKELGTLPTFYPVDLSIPMVSPMDVAEFAADIIAGNDGECKIYEIFGPAEYSSVDVANAFAQALHISVKAQQIPRNKWDDTLRKIGFSDDAIKNFIAMTEVVISGDVHAENNGKTIALNGKTTLQQYINQAVK
ncbi:NAD(P)H-binding protein [Mucilaginibacter sabulilitoris]|uniref:NAD(P)H-binding protein n=1 Tax=Mucilaginibacter sabulilitoris TaxID=1173583 RepID=A0ABZ0TLX7_9SPHI|nr:NAD(P)H-binding protein [Mucilaginibacter sabulilitoris]WPU93811.1 NAD(P)H-binding protein [Mucilaginibacter sabulilitoris]